MIIVTFNSHSYSSCSVLSKSCHIIAAVLGDVITILGILKRGHVTGDLTWHYFPKDLKERAIWVKNISKGLQHFVVSDYKVVCSNHFQF